MDGLSTTRMILPHGKGKGKVVPVLFIKAHSLSRDIALLILNLGARCR